MARVETCRKEFSIIEKFIWYKTFSFKITQKFQEM